MTDPIADMLTRIRNAQLVKKPEVVIPYSKLKFNLLQLFAKEGWIDNVEKIELSSPKAKLKKQENGDLANRFINLQVKLKYTPDGRAHINALKRVSKPGRRVYVGKDHIPIVLSGKGMSILSTSQGLVSDKQARAKKIGGEVVCEIY